MKIMTVLGTRPEIIRLSRVIAILDAHADHTVVHTGQNYDEKLSELFFAELSVRRPDVNLGARGPRFGEQVGQILAGFEEVLLRERPERVLILGDTNSGLVALIARRHGVPIYHMEAGNRCFDDRVPEEVNRRVIDHSSSVLLPYTERSRDHLLREGITAERILVTGNPIKEVIDHYRESIAASKVLETLGLHAGGYFLVTMHRAENVDELEPLRNLMLSLVTLAAEFKRPVICSLHPRTRARAQEFGLDLAGHGVRFLEPLGFFDFLRLEENAFCLVSDSGTVQEEGCILRVPNVTIRNVTERPETVECGSNVLAGTSPERILRAVRLVTSRAPNWYVPPEYMVSNVAETVARIILSHRLPDLAEQAWRRRMSLPLD